FSLMNTQWYIKQMIWAGVPMDFASPFKGTQYEGKYLQERRMGKTNKDFQEWVIDHLYYLRGEDRSIIYLKDMAVRNIIVSSLGRKPALRDLLMPVDSFVSKYITEDFNPSINIYFAATASMENKKGFENHLIMEGFVFRLTGRKGINMIDSDLSWDLLMNKFSYRSVDDPSIYKDRTAWRLLGNYASLLFSLGRSLRRDVVSAAVLVSPEAYSITLTEEEKETLRKAAMADVKGLEFSKESNILTTLMVELRGIYLILGQPEKLIPIIDKVLTVTDFPLIHLFRGQVLLDWLMLGEGLSENDRMELSKGSEREFEAVIEGSREGSAAAYLGLLNLYSTVGDSESMHFLVLDLLKQPEIYRAIFSYTIRYDTAKAIYLLEHWKEVNPYDEEATSLLKRLRNPGK
ncbi:hypothetical protein KAX29_07380, partial [candidate division WOR-3 bacterium]|nr:hypothetical protein [candidate division WOR-3 bacterium]